MSAFSVENPHDGKTFENYTRFEWGVEVGVATTFMLRLFLPHEFDMEKPDGGSDFGCAVGHLFDFFWVLQGKSLVGCNFSSFKAKNKYIVFRLVCTNWVKIFPMWFLV